MHLFAGTRQTRLRSEWDELICKLQTVFIKWGVKWSKRAVKRRRTSVTWFVEYLDTARHCSWIFDWIVFRYLRSQCLQKVSPASCPSNERWGLVWANTGHNTSMVSIVIVSQSALYSGPGLSVTFRPSHSGETWYGVCMIVWCMPWLCKISAISWLFYLFC